MSRSSLNATLARLFTASTGYVQTVGYIWRIYTHEEVRHTGYMILLAESLLAEYRGDFNGIAHAVLALGEAYCQRKEWDALDNVLDVALQLNGEEPGPPSRKSPLLDIREYLIMLADHYEHHATTEPNTELQRYRDTIF